MPKIRYAIKETGQGVNPNASNYIPQSDYKTNREPLYRARLWASLANIDRYLQTDSYRRLARYCRGDLLIQEIDDSADDCYNRKVVSDIRTIPAAEVVAAAALASTGTERKARGLLR